MADSIQYCARCKKPFKEGQTRYIVTISVVADFDGALAAPESARERSRMWEAIREASEEDLMRGVYERLSYVLCKSCRDAWTYSPFGPSAERGADGRMH